MRGRAAVGIDDDLAPGQAAVAVRPADDELAGRVHVELLVRDVPAGGEELGQQRAQHGLDLGLLEVLLVLGRDDDAGAADRLAVDVAQGDLALRIRQQPGDALVADRAQLLDAAEDAVRVIQRRRHQLGRLARGVAEHDALVAGAFVLVAGRVHALGDMGGLGVQVAFHMGVLPVEAFLLVADVLHRHAGIVDQQVGRDRIRAAHLAREDDAVGGDQRLAGDPGIGVRRQEGVEHRVGDPVGNLVGMAFGHGFRREKVFTLVAHGTVRPLVAWGTGKTPAGRTGRTSAPSKGVHGRGEAVSQAGDGGSSRTGPIKFLLKQR